MTTIRKTRRAVLAGFTLAGVFFGVSRPARASPTESASDWVMAGHARVRLIDAGADGGGRLAGLQIQLDPGYLTYWRSPGEAGLPPTVDFSGSRNLASAALRFPAPWRYDEAGSEAFGYKDEVVFPIAVTPADPRKPVELTVALSFALCEKQCLPASAKLDLALDGLGSEPEAGLVRAALARVPKKEELGSAAALAILSVTADLDRQRFRVLVRASGDEAPRLFAEAPEPWFLQAGDAEPAGEQAYAFALRVLAGAKASASVPITLTAASGEGAIETTVQLDVAAPTP